jgi:hypothetical protein
MKIFVVCCATFVAAACASTSAPEESIRVDVAQGETIRLWSVAAVRTHQGAKVSGFASRRLRPNEPVNEHLHAEALTSEGRVSLFNAVPWNSLVSLRAKKSASFQTEFVAANAEPIASVRLSVVPGAVHKEGQ